MLQSNLLQFHNPTHRNTSVSDPHSSRTGEHTGLWCGAYLYMDYAYGIQKPPRRLNKGLLKMLHFHYRNIRQLFGGRRKAHWLRQNDLSAWNWQGQHVLLIIFIITYSSSHTFLQAFTAQRVALVKKLIVHTYFNLARNVMAVCGQYSLSSWVFNKRDNATSIRTIRHRLHRAWSLHIRPNCTETCCRLPEIT